VSVAAKSALWKRKKFISCAFLQHHSKAAILLLLRKDAARQEEARQLFKRHYEGSIIMHSNITKYTAVIITVSDKGAQGLRVDTAGPAVKLMLEAAGFSVKEILIIPDEIDAIKEALVKAAGEQQVNLVLTAGGTGFSPRDVTPDATIAVCERLTPGIPEAMRLESLKITKRAMLTRAAAGIRGRTLIVNLPGSEKGAKENLAAILPALGHGLDMLLETRNECASQPDVQRI
jgi:molybdenum cofactor synthesis domain-containing protein